MPFFPQDQAGQNLLLWQELGRRPHVLGSALCFCSVASSQASGLVFWLWTLLYLSVGSDDGLLSGDACRRNWWWWSLDGEVIEGLVTVQLHICHGLWLQGGDLLVGELPTTVVAQRCRKLKASRVETTAQVNTCRWLWGSGRAAGSEASCWASQRTS